MKERGERTEKVRKKRDGEERLGGRKGRERERKTKTQPTGFGVVKLLFLRQSGGGAGATVSLK